MKKAGIILVLLVLSLNQCIDPVEYPLIPQINYESYYLYYEKDSLGSIVLKGQLNFSFTDGDGNVGRDPSGDSLLVLADTEKYNLFMQLYDYKENQFVEIPEEDGGYLKYIIPYLDKQPLQGTISVTLEYPFLTYDTIFYTFFIYDRDIQKSNTDTTDVRILYPYVDTVN